MTTPRQLDTGKMPWFWATERRMIVFFAILMAVVIAAFVITTWPADAAELPASDLLEVSAASPLGPDASITFSGAIGIRLFEFPDRWPLVGGKAAFASALTVGQYIALGGDVALQKAEEDSTGMRLGACWWRPDGDNEWAIYLRWKAWGW